MQSTPNRRSSFPSMKCIAIWLSFNVLAIATAFASTNDSKSPEIEDIEIKNLSPEMIKKMRDELPWPKAIRIRNDIEYDSKAHHQRQLQHPSLQRHKSQRIVRSASHLKDHPRLPRNLRPKPHWRMDEWKILRRQRIAVNRKPWGNLLKRKREANHFRASNKAKATKTKCP